MEDDVHATIAAASAAIAEWINGSVPNTDAAFESLRVLCHRDLSIVHPNGSSQEKGAILGDLRSAHGRNGEFQLAVPRQYTRLLHEDSALVVAEVIELQAGARTVSPSRHARRITMTCLKDQSAPHGLLIWRLHESIMPPAEEAELDWSSLDNAR